MPAYPDINGIRTSFASLVIGVDALPLVGVKSLNYRVTHERQKIRGTSAHPIGRTRGQVDYEGDIEFYQAEWYKFMLPKLSALGVLGFSETSHTLNAAWAEEASPLDIVADQLVGVTFDAPDIAAAEGPDAATVKLTMNIMRIVFDGRYVALRG
jgi:hypothetical protein